MEPTRAELALGALVPGTDLNYTGTRVESSSPTLTPSTFTYEGPAYRSKEANAFGLARDRLGRGSLFTRGSGYAPFVQSIAEMAYTNYMQLPSEAAGATGDELWDKLPEDYRTVMEMHGGDASMFAGLSAPDADEHFRRFAELIRINDRVARVQREAPAVAAAAGTLAVATNLITDPLNALLIGSSFGLSAVGRAVGKRALAKMTAQEIADEVATGTVKSGLRRLSVSMTDTAQAVAKGDSILTAPLGVQSEVVARTMLGASGTSIAVTQDFYAQLAEHEVLTEYDMITEEFDYSFLRGGFSFMMGLGASQIFAGGMASYWRKGNAAFAEYGVDSLTQRRFRSQVLRDPRRAEELIEARTVANMGMIDRIESKIFTAEERRTLPWNQDSAWFDKLADSGYALSEEEIVTFLMKVPTKAEFDRFIKNFDPNKPVSSVSLTAATKELADTTAALEKAKADLETSTTKIKDQASKQRDIEVAAIDRKITNAKRRLKRRQDALARVNKSRSFADNAETRARVAVARENLVKAEADLARYKQNIVDAGTRRGQAPRDINGDPQMQMPGLRKSEAEVLARMQSKVRAAEDTVDTARRAVREIGMEGRANMKAKVEADVAEVEAEIKTLTDSKTGKQDGNPLDNPNAVQQSQMVNLRKQADDIAAMTKEQTKLSKAVEKLTAAAESDAVKEIDTSTSFSRAARGLNALLRLRKAQVEGTKVTDDMITRVINAFQDLLPADVKRLEEAGFSVNDMSLDPISLRNASNSAVRMLENVRDDLKRRGFKAEGTSANKFVSQFTEYWSKMELLTPYARTQEQKVSIINGLLDKDVLANVEFLSTGDVEKYLRQNLIKYLGPLTDLFTRSASFRNLEKHLLNKNTPIEDIHAIGYIIDIFAHMGTARQRKSAINPNVGWVGGAFHQYGRAEAKINRSLAKYAEAIELSKWDSSNTEGVHAINKVAFQIVAGTKKATDEGLDPRAVAGAAVLRQLFDDLGNKGMNNGALKSLLDNYLDIQLHPGNATPEVRQMVATRYHKRLADAWLTDPDAQLHSATLTYLDWARWEEVDGVVNLVPTERGIKELGLSTETMDIDLDAVRLKDLDPDAQFTYGDAISNSDGALFYESKRAIRRRIKNTEIEEEDFNKFGVYKDETSSTGTVFLKKQDVNMQRKIDQTVWFEDDILDTGIVETNMFKYLGNLTGKAYKIYRQDFVNDYYGRIDLDFGSMMGSMRAMIDNVDNDEIKEALEVAFKQISEIDEQFARSSRYVHEADMAELTFAVRQFLSAKINLATAPLVIGVEGTGSAARALLDGDFFGAIKQMLNYIALTPADARRGLDAIGTGMDEMSRTSHVTTGSNAEKLSRAGVTSADKFLSIRDAFRKSKNKKPDGSNYRLITRIGAGLNEASRVLGFEEHLSRANRISTLEHEFWLAKKYLRKLPAAVEALKKVNPDNAKEFRAALREAGFNNEAYARNLLSSGLGEPDALNVLRALPDDAFDSIGNFQAALDALNLDQEGHFTDRMYVMWKQQVDTWNPANNPFAQASEKNPVHSFVLMFTTHANNFFSNNMMNIGNRQNGPAAALAMTYMMMEYTAYVARGVAQGYIDPDEVRRKMDEDPIGVIADAMARSAIGGPWIGGIIGAPLDMLKDSGVMEGGLADALPTSIGSDMMQGTVRKSDKAIRNLFDGRGSATDFINASPLANRELVLLYDALAQDNK